MNEGLNPTRRYKWFRPRQGARAAYNQASGVNFATVALYNNSTAAQLLVVRDYRVLSGSQFVQTTAISGKIGTVVVSAAQPILGGEAALPGQLFALDAASLLNPDYLVVSGSSGDAWWAHDFPFAVLQPNSSLVFQAQAQTGSCGVALAWESIFADELDFAFEW